MNIKRILAQLQQRRVTRVAAIYAAVAWALLQVADVMFPIIGLGDNAVTMVLLLALVGFPLSLVSSWIFDLTSEGITQTSDAEIDREIERVRLTPIRVAAIVGSMALFGLVGYLYLERLNEGALVVAYMGHGSRQRLDTMRFQNNRYRIFEEDAADALDSRHGAPIVVMPRRGALRETRNDHQIATAVALSAQGRVSVAMDETELAGVLDAAKVPVDHPVPAIQRRQCHPKVQ